MKNKFLIRIEIDKKKEKIKLFQRTHLTRKFNHIWHSMIRPYRIIYTSLINDYIYTIYIYKYIVQWHSYTFAILQNI